MPLHHDTSEQQIMNQLVGCNFYVSAGRVGSSKFLVSLLLAAQVECHHLRMESGPKLDGIVPAVLVHAFADSSYDRSSFHLAGTSWAVQQVTTTLANLAITALKEQQVYEEDDSNSKMQSTTAHPHVGFVDHVSIMPLMLPTTASVATFLSKHDFYPKHAIDPQQQQHACGEAAKNVGKHMSEMGWKIHYYGSASSDNASLAHVRKERTNFFKSGGLDEACSTPNIARTTSCVGSPLNFVENFNIRLSASDTASGKKAATSLCRALRERDGGLQGVEGLTLPHSSSSSPESLSWEVACNLLEPQIGSRDAIRQKANSFIESYNHVHSPPEIIIEDMYGVGTTQEECFKVLQLTEEGIDEHDENVAARFVRYLTK